MDQNSDDDGDSGEPITKMEDDSDETDGDDREPAFVDVPSTSADDQPGPSGVSKDGSDAPCSDTNAKINKTESGKADAPIIENEKKDDSKKPNPASSAKNGHPKVANITLNDGICGICDGKFENKKSLLRHLLTSHRSVVEASKRLTCKGCNSEIDNMQKHLETVHNLKGSLCPICSKAFSGLDAVIDHFKMSHLQVMAKLTCAICKLVYAKMEGLISHYHEKHKPEVEKDSAKGSSDSGITSTFKIPKKKEETRAYEVCIICENKFDPEESLSQHYLSVHNYYITQNKTWKCSKCSTIFSTKKAMKNHLQAQHKVEGSFCPICYKGFMTKSEVHKHLKSLHIEVITQLSCSVCRLEFPSQADLISHCQSKHANVAEKTTAPSIDKPKMWRCTHCTCAASIADTKEGIKKHFEMKHKLEGNWCPICGMDFNTALEATNHLTEVHVKGMTKLTCVNCFLSSEFASYDDLKSHYHEKHTYASAKDPYLGLSCMLCDTKCKTKLCLVNHCRSNHPQFFKDTKVWRCQLCPTSFMKNETSAQHHIERKHTMNGNSCFSCKSTFATYDATVQHVKSSHVLTMTKLSCGVCHTVLANDQRVMAHVFDKHRVQKEMKLPVVDKESANVSDVYPVQKKEESNPTRFECYICSQRYVCDLELVLHLADVHKVVILDSDFDKQKFFGCPACMAKFSTMELAVGHLNRTHSGITDPIVEKYICSYCNLTMNRTDFRSHLVRCATLSGPPRCRYCLINIHKIDLLQIHMRYKHPTEDDLGTRSLAFSCPLCNKKFSSHEALLGHAQIKHPLRIRKNAPPVPLEATLNTFSKGKGNTFYQCPFCKYACPKLTIIMKHIVAQHRNRRNEISDPISMRSQGAVSKSTLGSGQPLLPDSPGSSSGSGTSATKSYDSRSTVSYGGAESSKSPWPAESSHGHESRPFKAVYQSGVDRDHR